MKICLLKQDDFTFNNVPSSELKLLGKNCIEHLLAEFDGSCVVSSIGEVTELTVFVFSRCPLTKHSEIEKVVRFVRENNLKGAISNFCIVIDSGGTLSECVPFAMQKKPSLETLGDYPLVLQQIRHSINNNHLFNGVLIENIDTTFIDSEVKIEEGVIIKSNCVIKGESTIGKSTTISSNCEIVSSIIGESCVLTSSVVLSSKIGDKTAVGPNAFIRPGCEIGKSCRIGNFVEVKNSVIGSETKIAHLAYVGDAEVGRNVNIGCGVVFANYDGTSKHRTVIGNNCFIGSNCNLIAPLEIGSNVFVAAGTTVTIGLIDNDFCIGRVRETIKTNYAARFLRIKK